MSASTYHKLHSLELVILGVAARGGQWVHSVATLPRRGKFHTT